jgi:hypothetical protein
MAEQQQNNIIYTLGVMPGIKRDGTQFESREFTDGVWTRFQRGVPKKMGGYRQMFRDNNGIPRGLIANAYNGINYLFSGNANTLDAFTTGTTLGVGSGPFVADMLVGYGEKTLVSATSPSFVVAGDVTAMYPAGTKIVFNQTPGEPIYTVLSSSYTSPNTTVTLTTAFTGTPTKAWLADTYYEADVRNLWSFDIQYSPQGDSLQVLAHPGKNLLNIDNGIQSQIYTGDILAGPGNTWTFRGLADTEGANPTFRPITADGGLVVLYPFIFVYGSNGFIANNHVDTTYADQNFFDWNGPLANQVNMTAGKIVKGMPVRGGTNSPSGLFWATDSLVRVSFTGQQDLYWRYDIISSQTSIMSSNCVVEMDGIYYWMGVDRFYKYNGAVSVVPNDKNVNWLFDNLNYEQRQKVWATKVPRYNEVWFFYPRGSATECTDAIIYNVKDNTWYDAGQADGARRSCGYTTEVFPTPIWCSWEFSLSFGAPYPVIATPSGLPAPATDEFYLSGDVTPVFAPGETFQFSTVPGDYVYNVDTATYDIATNSTLVKGTSVFVVYPNIGQAVYPTNAGYSIWQQEYGLNEITDEGTFAIPASITTCDISWIGGTPAQDAPSGVNRRMHLRRVEPDFVQGEDMTLQIIGRKFARGTEELSPVFTFGPNDGKIDMRIENREARLTFASNTTNGNFEMGRIMITAEYGDERP